MFKYGPSMVCSMATLPECTIVIFGATGDLAKRKLIPALHTLHTQLHPKTRIIAIGRRDYTDDDIRRELQSGGDGWAQFSERISYHHLEFHDAAAYDLLKERITTANRIFYLATAPESFKIIISHLSSVGLASASPKKGWHRVVFEKPFGNNLASAQQLNKEVTRLFDERQIYRIDHYLGKELVQDILVLRFSNPIFERLWEREHVDNVQIIVAEKAGVGTRGGYYDSAGALRDMVQNHMLQLLTLTAMEAPATLDADDIRGEKVKVLRQVQLPSQLGKSMVLGQYTAGTIDGKQMPGYCEEKGVARGSRTETFAAVKLFVQNQRWHGVPFYLQTGKALPNAYAEVVITFKQTPCILFCGPDGTLAPNTLAIRIQPDEGIKLQFNLKERGEYSVRPVAMDFSHKAEFGMNTPEAYERLLADVMRGDQTLFTRWDEVEYAWRIVDRMRKAKVPLAKYRAGTCPDAAAAFMKKDGRAWYGNKAVKG
jgi:glucose-6-phosphate 1-dehydrogenase